MQRLNDETRLRMDRVSTLFDNPAVGGPAGSPPFLNAVAAVDTTLEPEPLLDRLLRVERDMGRVHEIKWEPHIIDLDLLLFGNRVLRTSRLTLPHPLLHRREFVLKPLVEIRTRSRCIRHSAEPSRSSGPNCWPDPPAKSSITLGTRLFKPSRDWAFQLVERRYAGRQTRSSINMTGMPSRHRVSQPAYLGDQKVTFLMQWASRQRAADGLEQFRVDNIAGWGVAHGQSKL